MKKNKIFLYLILSSILFTSCSQSFYLKKANKEYADNHYYLANENYKRAINKKDVILDEDNLKIANTFYIIKDYKNALKHYKKVDVTKRDYKAQLNYAKILQFNKDYEKSKQAFIDLKKTSAKQYSDTTINNFIASCELALNKKEPEFIQYKLNKSKIDVQGESFGIAFYNNGILYSAPVPAKKNYIIHIPFTVDKYGNTFKNIFFSNISEKGVIKDSSVFEDLSNSKHHVGSVSYLPDSNRFFFSETIKEKNKSVIKIFSIDKKGEEFTNLKELDFNSNTYSCAHPSISADGKTLYFASDMKGGYGGTDIYSSEFKDNKWNKPQNLGDEVSTEATEMFPFIKDNGVLYFSSNGKIGYGGLDIYYTLNTNGKWTHIVHKDMPINSNADDFAYVENPNNNKQIYISSNRNSTPGNDNIYFAEKLELAPDTIRGRIIDNLTDKALTGATLCLLIDSISGDTIAKAFTDENGNYTLVIPKKREGDDEERLFTVIKKDGYEDKVIDFEGRYNDTDRPPLKNVDVAMKVKIKAKQVIEFHNIYFDFGKADLKEESIQVLDKLIEVMNENEKMVIELSAHTDSKSSRKYNQKLSDRRAKSAKKYMVSKGINSNRIVAKGYGESRLINSCTDKVECSDEEHATNRRIEVKVISN